MRKLYEPNKVRVTQELIPGVNLDEKILDRQAEYYSRFVSMKAGQAYAWNMFTADLIFLVNEAQIPLKEIKRKIVQILDVVVKDSEIPPEPKRKANILNTRRDNGDTQKWIDDPLDD